ncbi:hypothetical protein [Wolbachia endosymbiont of Ctenocephalides felis wCfeJ]|uniref:hypothetical protein n=1 Tax=Wolbachia endosymbiont of Ctenocephalides felis wCfeJ TaxID=2732594 RepID=UPI001445B42D|nr:hypothetical protein [Wolbachia endosymbiont of Ctenocephalides felis wCfeJ]WCR58406.1 MAG: hypothetical protein PG980_000878 [Wolbachia endosymbiont of Ctenocephalides felis wCfeJ]
MHVVSGESHNKKGNKDNGEHSGEKRKVAENASASQQKKQSTSEHVCRKSPGYICICEVEKYFSKRKQK